MHTSLLTHMLAFYGAFLIVCGIVAVTFIGAKAKTALISGGTSGAAALFISYLLCKEVPAAQWGGIILSLGLLCVFSWRSAKTLFKVFELIPTQAPELKGKGIAFLIISMMAVVSLVVLMLQVVLFCFH